MRAGGFLSDDSDIGIAISVKVGERNMMNLRRGVRESRANPDRMRSMVETDAGYGQVVNIHTASRGIGALQKQSGPRPPDHDVGNRRVADGPRPDSDPETSEKALEEARKRSPVSWLANAKDVLPVDINTGIHDGHTGSVPVGQSIRAYNLLAAPEDRIPEADIAFIEENEKIPSHLAAKEGDPAYGTHAILLRKRSRQVRLTIFEGRHDMFFETAFDWLGRQISGHPADFSAGQPIDLSDNAHLGK